VVERQRSEYGVAAITADGVSLPTLTEWEPFRPTMLRIGRNARSK